MTAPARWQTNEGVVTDTATEVQLRVGFPAGALDPSAARALARRVAALLNFAERERALTGALRRLAVATAWPAAVAASVLAVLDARWALLFGYGLFATAVGALITRAVLRGCADDAEAARERGDVAIETCLRVATGEHPAIPAAPTGDDLDADDWAAQAAPAIWGEGARP